MKVKTAVVYEKGQDFKMEELDLTAPKSHEVLVRIVASGVCHTDEVAKNQQIPVAVPIVLGHEGAGLVEAIGSDVTDVAVGDHVVISYASCGTCSSCQKEQPYICTSFNELNFGDGSMPAETKLSKEGEPVASFFGQSSFATFTVVDEHNLIKIDKDVDLTLMGPLGCGIQTGAGTVLNELQPKEGESIVVFGCGAVGLSAVMAAKIAKCGTIIAVDINKDRLNLAKELGATHVINSLEVDNLVKEIKSITGEGAHYAIETTGRPALLNDSLYGLRPRGTSAIVGVVGEVTIDIYQAILIECKRLVGIVEGSSNPKTFIPELIDYYKQGQFPFDKLINVYPFEDINQAFEDSKTGVAIKPILKMVD